jgi:DNA helicase-2/ATP-dependent DNA helicase PcrA
VADKHLAGLNAEQRRAVMATKGPVLVLAGAGTGKTRVITTRIAQLLAEGVAAENVLAVTFTNKAAREMRERVTALVGKKNGKALTVGTFHRFCLDLLREHATKVGLPRKFSICDASDQQSAVRKALRELDVGDEVMNPRAAQARISLFKNRMVGPDEALKGAADDSDELVGRAYRRYEEHLRSVGTVDFDDLLLMTERLLRENERVREAVRDRFRYVLVDEYQDTNGPQYAIVKHVADGHRNLCVVGDDDQSIYGWRGADVTRILRFEKDFPGCLVTRLETNYRSTEPILNAANRVIANNPKRHEKSLKSALGAGDPVMFRPAPDEHEEADTVVREIQWLDRTRKARLGDIAVLFRTGVQARVFETQLRARGVPYVLVGGPSFFDRKEVRDVLAYLRLVDNAKDEASFLRIVNCPPRGVGKTSLERAIGHASRERVSVMDAFAGGGIEGISAAATEAVQGLLRLTATLGGGGRIRDLVHLVRDVVDAVGYRTEVDRRYPDPGAARERWGAVEEIQNAAENYQRRSRKANLTGFLQELTLSADDDRSSEDAGERNVVTLMTLHAAKGLEFPRVYLVGLEEGLLPHLRSVAEDTIEEERRLMYVGITRAKRQLTLSCAGQRSRGGQRILAHPSRFLFELRRTEPPEDWVAAGAPPPALKKSAKKSAAKKRKGASKRSSARGRRTARG